MVSTAVDNGGAATQVSGPIAVVGNRATSSVQTASGNTHASASATYGLLSIGTDGAISAGGSNGGAQASFDDRLTLSNAALNGKSGQVTLAYYFNYDAWVNGSTNGFANGSISFNASANYSYSWYMDYLRSDQPGYTMYEHRDPYGYGRVYDVPKTNYLYVTTDFTWGQSISTSFGIQTSIGSYVPSNAAGSASYNFAATSAYWGGIVSATADGQRVTSYDLTSASGTDYSRSFAPASDVPEPATPAIFMAGLVLLASFARASAAKRK
jgi:hypothetical protein